MADSSILWAPAGAIKPCVADYFCCGNPVYVRPPAISQSTTGSCSRVELTFSVPSDAITAHVNDWQLYVRPGGSQSLQPIAPVCQPTLYESNSHTLLTYM